LPYELTAVNVHRTPCDLQQVSDMSQEVARWLGVFSFWLC
jgi:hypothetical protein